MTDYLPSYVQGAWWTPSGAPKATEVRDASTGEVITRVSTEGLDLAGALDYARTTGHASLAALTFHQRAVLLKQFALALTERKDELYALSTRTGATWRMAAWWVCANMKQRLVSDRQRSSASGPSPSLRPSAPSTSAVPDFEDAARFPCLATGTPQEATMIEASVEML